MKYEFIVKPRGDYQNIQLKIAGIQPRIDKDGNLIYNTSFGTITEKAPLCFQIIQDDTIYIKSKFNLNNQILSFELLESYDKSYSLIIDPDLAFSTYSGATIASFYAFTSNYDDDANMYSAGIAWGLGWPVDTGAYQKTFNYYTDVCIIKFNNTGSSKIMATYYGGYGDDVPMSIAINKNKEIAIGGFTNSANLPMLNTSYDSTLNNAPRSASIDNTNGDIFIITLNSTGTQLIGATYIGGTNDEARMLHDLNNATDRKLNSKIPPFQLQFDSVGNHIWFISNTSSTNYPITSSAIQNTNAGQTDGVITKIKKTCDSLIYSTYMGGSNLDYPTYFIFDAQQRLVIASMTKSDSLITQTGSFHQSLIGSTDGYICIYNPITNQINASTYVGTSAFDAVLKLTINPNNQNIYVLGISAGAYPISTGKYSNTNGNCFIQILNSDLNTNVGSTRIGHNVSQGGSNYWLPTAFGVSKCNDLIVSGIQISGGFYQLSMPVTNNAYQSNKGAFWFASFDLAVQNLKYATYLGNPGLDHLHAGQHSVDEEGNLYHSICSTNPSFPITPGVWASQKLNGSQLDIISFKFNIGHIETNADFTLENGYAQQGCAPYTVIFKDLSTHADIYKWHFGTGDSSDLINPTYTFNNPGIYNVLLITHDTTCNTVDSAYMTIKVDSTITPQIIIHDTLLCSYYDSLFYTGASISNYSNNMLITWSPSFAIFGSVNNDSLWVKPFINNTYYINVKGIDTTKCIKPQSASINIHRRDTTVANFAINKSSGCVPLTIQFTNLSKNASRYLWKFGTTDSSTLEHPIHTFTQIGNYLVRLYTYDDICNTTDYKDTVIQVKKWIEPVITLSDTFLCNKDSLLTINATVLPYDTIIKIQWEPTNAINNISSNGRVLNVNPLLSSSFSIRVFNNNKDLCVKTDSATINIAFASDSGMTITPPYSLICIGDSVTLKAEGNGHIEWIKNNSIIHEDTNSIIVKPSINTEYAVYFTDDSNCVFVKNAVVDVMDTLIIDAGIDKVIKYGDAVQLDGNSIGGYHWFPEQLVNPNNIANPTVQPESTTTYYLKSTLNNGCDGVDSVTIIVTNTKIPNAFTPNGDGLNDKFKVIQFKDNVILERFSIYNRYGNLVFETKDINEGWDGNYNKEPCDVGVYFYYVIYRIGNKRYTEKGDVSLLR